MRELQRQLIRDEGNIPYAYQDHLGYWTIGIGFLIDQKKGGKLLPEEIDFIFNNRMEINRRELERRLPFFSRLSKPRQGVLLNMAYQLGVRGVLNFAITLSIIESGDYERASKEMLNSLWARQTPERAKRLSVQMLTDQWQ